MTGAIDLSREADFSVGGLGVRPASGEVSFGGELSRLEPRVMQVLVALSRRPGEPVSREELVDACWGGVAVTDDALTRCVSQLRKTLASTSGEILIDTIPKVGYRLAVSPPRTGGGAKSHRRTSFVAAMLLAATGLAAVIAYSNRDGSPTPDAPRSVPLTTLPGVEQWPAISPSGGQIAFSRRDASRSDRDIFVQSIGSDSRLRLTDSRDQEYHPVWSPDGGRIAFVRLGERGCEIAVVAAVGGRSSRLSVCGAGGVIGLDWSSTDEHLVFTHRQSPHAPGRAVLFSLQDYSARAILVPEHETESIEDVAFSPDGKKLAYTVGLALGVEDAYVHSLERNTTTRVTRDNLKIHGLDWTPDGSALVVSSNRGGEFALWQVPLDGRPPSLVPGAVGGADEPRTSRTGRLVYEAWRSTSSIWSLSLRGGDAPRLLIPTTRTEWDAQRSPDGQRLAFVSDRSGAAEVWVADDEGQSPARLTTFEGAYTHTPRFSPDGRTIAFATPAAGNFDLFLVDVDAVTPQRLTEHPAEDFAPAWSPDATAMYFGSTRSGEWQIWRLDLAEGSLRQVTSSGGRVPRVSLDGVWLYYTKPREAGLFRVAIATAEASEERILDGIEPVDWNNWQVLERAIYYVRRPVPDEPEIVRYDLASGATAIVTRVPDLLHKSGIWVAPDESEILFSRVGVSEADIMLLENALR